MLRLSLLCFILLSDVMASDGSLKFRVRIAYADYVRGVEFTILHPELKGLFERYGRSTTLDTMDMISVKSYIVLSPVYMWYIMDMEEIIEFSDVMFDERMGNRVDVVLGINSLKDEVEGKIVYMNRTPSSLMSYPAMMGL